jgi:hypothetical protein
MSYKNDKGEVPELGVNKGGRRPAYFGITMVLY